MTKSKTKRVSIPVSLPSGLAKEVEELVESGEFSSKSEAVRYGVRLLVLTEKKLRTRAEDYAYDEVVKGIKRGKRNVS